MYAKNQKNALLTIIGTKIDFEPLTFWKNAYLKISLLLWTWQATNLIFSINFLAKWAKMDSSDQLILQHFQSLQNNMNFKSKLFFCRMSALFTEC